jgi:hypothetical protein
VPQGDITDQQLETMLKEKLKTGILKPKPAKPAKPAKSDSDTAENKVNLDFSSGVKPKSQRKVSWAAAVYQQQQHQQQQNQQQQQYLPWY